MKKSELQDQIDSIYGVLEDHADTFDAAYEVVSRLLKRIEALEEIIDGGRINFAVEIRRVTEDNNE